MQAVLVGGGCGLRRRAAEPVPVQRLDALYPPPLPGGLAVDAALPGPGPPREPLRAVQGALRHPLQQRPRPAPALRRRWRGAAAAPRAHRALRARRRAAPPALAGPRAAPVEGLRNGQRRGARAARRRGGLCGRRRHRARADRGAGRPAVRGAGVHERRAGQPLRGAAVLPGRGGAADRHAQRGRVLRRAGRPRRPGLRLCHGLCRRHPRQRPPLRPRRLRRGLGGGVVCRARGAAGRDRGPARVGLAIHTGRGAPRGQCTHQGPAPRRLRRRRLAFCKQCPVCSFPLASRPGHTRRSARV
ncbi:hypothetical protein Rsub_11610 [Raphidocelis subcapitata]|uniref:Uncharacterized protein n=1 Tax=Raphidocelis subcapitata TaxID=307507 RepID=A0A2V0PPP9_9CHLO|nr:hypothetical protein Rsub_11610 [Raphidocelis subcapitata]|eukprot:GBF99165.1 hypothetical protein Rsub_11610 [Raphidocelis subcapitata]